MKEKKIDDDMLKEYLFTNVLQTFMTALGSGDEAAMREVTEKTFADKIVAEMPKFKEKGLKYTKVDKFDPESVYMIDKMFLKGISAERSKNDTNFDYVVNSEDEKNGLKIYCHKYNLGYLRYYFLKEHGESVMAKLTVEESKKDPEAFYYRER